LKGIVGTCKTLIHQLFVVTSQGWRLEEGIHLSASGSEHCDMAKYFYMTFWLT